MEATRLIKDTISIISPHASTPTSYERKCESLSKKVCSLTQVVKDKVFLDTTEMSESDVSFTADGFLTFLYCTHMWSKLNLKKVLLGIIWD